MPEKVEEKIRYLLRKFPSTEWSGVLFTTHEGTFEKGDLVITCQDIYPMDLGNAVYTQFNMNEDVTAYMAENIELFDCDLQLVHSHHSMPTTPSGTDLNTLREEGNERNCFVSLIVNNAGKYYAAVTRKVQTKSEVTVKKLGTSYEFFGEGTKNIVSNNTKDADTVTKAVEKEIIEYFDLEVERHEVSNPLSYLDSRFEEIEQKKHPKQGKLPWDGSGIHGSSFFEQLHQKSNKSEIEGNLWEDRLGGNKAKVSFSKEDDEKLNAVMPKWEPNPTEIQLAAIRIITCNLTMADAKFDIKQWIKRHLNRVYDRIFGEAPNEETMAFGEWKDFIIDFTLTHFSFKDIPDGLLDDWDLATSKVAEAIYDELSKYSTMSGYIGLYQEALESYIIE